MAHRTIQAACNRFRGEVSPEDSMLIEATTGIDDVKLAIGQVQRQLAERRLLRSISRIRPFLDATERYFKVLEAAIDGIPYLSCIWGSIKTILLAVQVYTDALDKVLSVYNQIGLQMPQFSRFAVTFANDHSFQQLLGSLFENVLEFHRRALAMIRKPGWKMLFSSSWRIFENSLGSILENIARVSGVLTLTLMMLRRQEENLSANSPERGSD